MTRSLSRFVFSITAPVIAFSLMLASCNLPTRASPTQTLEAMNTSAALTLSALTAQSLLQASATPTMTASPTSTASPTTAPPTNASATPIPIPCNRAQFVSDVTVPDGTIVEPGATFKKTWRLRNTGSCTWNSGYVLMFDRGDRMDAPATAPLTTGNVAPNDMLDVSLDLKAPLTPGTYQAYFRLRSPDNIVFGVGPNGEGAFWVKIAIPQPTPTMTPTGTATPTGTSSG
jgi:hypothetical protein